MSRFAMDWSEFSLQVMITFGHFLWQACVVGCVLLVAQHVAESLRDSQLLSHRGGRKRGVRGDGVSLGETDLRGANIRYAIACMAFFSLPICVIATFAWVHQSRGPILLFAVDPVGSSSSPVVSANEAMPTMANSGIPVLTPPATPMNAGAPVTKPIEPPTLVEEPQTSRVQRIQAFAPYLLLAYIVGVGFMLARFSLSIIGSSRLRQTIQPITDVKLLRTIAEQCARVGLKRIPIVALCQRVSVPVVVGIVKPMILLPPALLCSLDPNQIAAILSHELAHIRRYDLILNFLQRVVEALLFFHPVTWWISRRVSIERENCCDDVAAACMGRLPYAGALLQMAELCIGNDRRRSAALATLSASGSNSTDLGYRIRRLIGAEETTRIGFTRRSISIGMALISLLAVSLVAWGQNQKSQDEEPADGSMQKIFTPVPLWQTKLANDDVASDMLRISPVVVAGKRVLSIERDFDLSTGKEVESTFVRLPRKNVLDMTLDPIFRRKSSDRRFLVEVSVRGLGKISGLDKGWGLSSCDIRVLRATDGMQVGTTIHVNHFFDGITSDVDVENGGDFLVLGDGNEVQVYRTETGQVETTMPIKTKRIDAVAISPDLEWLVVSDQNDLHFWRWRDQAPVKTIHMGRKIDSLVFTPDGQYLAEGPDTREDIQVRDMRTLEVIASLKDEVGSPLMVSSMDITPDGRYLVAHNEVSVDQSKLTIPHRIHVWDLQSRGKPVFQIATGEWVRKVEFSDDGRMIVGEFSGAAHGTLLAAWQLPNEIVQRQIDSPLDAKDRLGDGIQWSRFGDENGLLSGARLILPKDGLKPGQPLVVEYRLANVSKEKKTLNCYLNFGMEFASLGSGNRISSGFGLDLRREPVTLTIESGGVFIDQKHLVSIDTTGLEPGEYQVALGSAFCYPDATDPNVTHEIPHRGSIPFSIIGESAVKVSEPVRNDIQWGKPIAGLQAGARFIGDPTGYTIGATIEADLFVANVTDQPIECSVVLPHPRNGWLSNVADANGRTIMLQQPIPSRTPFPQEYVQLKLAPGEVTVLPQDQDKKDGTLSRPRSKFEIADAETEEQGWSDYTVKGRLVTKGGTYSAIFDIVILRPEIPALRLELDTGNVPFSVKSRDEKPDSNKQSFKLIDGETGKPLQRLKCQAIFAKLNASPRYQACTTDEHGVVEVDVAKDESAGIAEVPSGWFSSGFGPVYVVAVPESEQQPQQNAEKKNQEPTIFKLWRGTEVDGRLLWPDKTPAAGVTLTAGVYNNNQTWKEKLGMDLTHYSFDHGDWPNWSRTIVTDDDGNFRVTVPPKDARFWLRIGTTQLGFGPQINVGDDEAITQRLAKCVPLEIQYGGSSRSNSLIVHDIPETDDLVLHTGDLPLETGVIVRGRVVDAEGKGLANVRLTSTGPHGPHSGRSATSGEDGKFEFPAMAAGILTVHPDARLLDDTKAIPDQIVSRDVQAVFVDESFTIPSVFLPHEITVRAVPHTEVTFEWVDRRADKTQSIAYYGAFRVRGYMPDENGKPATYWSSETERVERDGKQWLTVKIPTQLLKPDLMLAADSKVTASYSDSTGVTSGPGIVELGDITASTTRTIFGDEPREPEDSRESPQRARNDQSSWTPARPLKVTVSGEGSAKILEDHSVRLEGDVQWQEASLQFVFDKPTNVQEIRLEILPVDSPTGPQFGRGGEELMFDVKPGIEDQTGKFTSLDFASCTYLQNPSDDTTVNCIDYLSDTGWKVPPLPADETAHELVLRFEKPIALRADQRLTLTVDSGGAKELAILNRIRVAFRQRADGEAVNANSTMSGSDVGASIITGGANEKIEPWEISKLYDAGFLRNYLQDHEALPKPIVVPAVSGKVFDPDGKPASGVSIVSHTPRHWVDLDATLALKPHNTGGVRKSKQDGTFGLPERTEPYRVLLVHESGIANVSHEELLRANGVVTLQKWASVSGTLKLGGKPQADETITLEFDTLPWSYSRGGPRLTTTHRTTTDKDGNFSFDRVPPLGGLAHHLSRDRLRGHGAVYQCESGKNTHIEIGVGITVTGKLSLPEHRQKNRLKVYARNHLLPIPYPKDWTDKVTKEERLAWLRKWSSTGEGCELEDRNFVLTNSNVPGSILDDGKFTIYGVPEKPMVLVVAIPGEAILLEKPFDCTGSTNEALDLGMLTVADNHDHHHDEVKQEDQPDGKPQLPRLIVKTIDSDEKPGPNTGVLFYDRNSHRAGQKQKFEMVNKRTDESGVADFGVIPNRFGCLQLSASNNGLAECYMLISTTMTKCTQGNPPRANVQTEIKDGILTVTFTMTPHVDLEFNIVDDATNEIVFWSEIFYQDPATNRWWQFALVDGSQMQHNFIPISPQITKETIRISALGYETKVFRLPDELDRSQPIRRDVRLKPMPDVELKVLLPDGTPAEKAKLTFHYPNELDCLQDLEQFTDAQGIMTTKFPPNADIGTFRFEHTGGTAELSMEELLDVVQQNSGEVIRRSIALRM